MTGTRRFEFSGRRRELLDSLLRAEGIDRADDHGIPVRSDPGGPVPLTYQQHRLWFLERVAEHNATYVISAALRVRGPFRPELFARACAQVARRHQSLRTVFRERDGRPVQQVRDDLEPEVVVREMPHLDPGEREPLIQAREAELIGRPFDLGAGPAFRVEVLRFAADDAAILLNVHHLVSDRWSMGVLMRELTHVYAALADGAPVALPELPVQYPDFAAWQQNASHRERWEKDLRYWKGRLRDVPADLGLRTDRPRPRQKTYRGSSVPVRIPAELVRRARDLARAEGATPFMVFAAVLQTMLFRLGDGDDIVIGTPVAGRERVELEPLIGLFVNTLALRTGFGDDPDFRTLLRRVKDGCLEAYDHQSVPFEKVVEEVRPERSLSGTPVFQVLLSYQNVPFPSWRQGEVRVEPVPLPARKAEFDLLLDLFEDGGTVWGRLEYSLDIFGADGAERIARLFVRLLRAALEAPETAVSRLPLPAEGELDTVLDRGAAQQPPAGARRYVLDRFRQPVPPGFAGELYLAGPAIGTAGERVADPFVPGEWMRPTGEVARRAEDGALEILGSAGSQVRVRGFRVHLEEVEAVLVAHERVERAVVVAQDRDTADARLVAHLVCTGPVRAGELIDHVRRQLPDHMVPAHFVVLAEIPVTPGGEPDRSRLPQVSVVGTAADAPFEDPRAGLERWVADAWRDLLTAGRIGRHDDFFDLGGHSLLLTRLAAAIRREHGIQASIRDLFDAPTVASMAAWIAARRSSGEARAVPVPVARRDAGLPLSFAQEQLCLHHPVPVTDPYHNVLTALRLRGRLDERALRGALDDVVARHEALRTRIVRGDTGWHQVVDPAGDWPLGSRDLSGLDPRTRPARLEQALRETSAEAFDIGRGPLVRGALLRTGPDEHVLALVMHHLVTDNWSYGVLVGELSELYRARLHGERPALPELPVQYPDIAAWQRGRLADGALDGQLDHWRSRLRDLVWEPRFRAPGTWNGAAVTGATTGFAIGPETAARLKRLAADEGATLFMVLTASFHLLLAAHTDGEEVCTAFPVAGREPPETAPLIGYFVNHLPIRSRPHDDLTFLELLARIRESTLGAYANQEAPLRILDEFTGAGTDPFRVLFNLLNADVPAVELSGLRAAPLDGGPGDDYVFSEVITHMEAKEVDLALIMREDGEGLRGMWLHGLDRVDPRAMAAMAGRWEPLLALAASAPERTLGELRRGLPADRPGTAADADRGRA